MSLIEKIFDKIKGDKNKNNNNNGNSNGNNNNVKNNINVNGNQGKSNVDKNNTRPVFTGSIINRTGNKIRFPGHLKKIYIVQILRIQKRLAIVEHHVFLNILSFLLDITKMISHQ